MSLWLDGSMPALRGFSIIKSSKKVLANFGQIISGMNSFIHSEAVTSFQRQGVTSEMVEVPPFFLR